MSRKRRTSGVPWAQSYWFKLNLYMAVWVFFATYYHTEYFFELLGLEVRDASGRKLGAVTAVHDTAAHVLLEISTAPPRFIPFIAQHIAEVSLAEGYLVTSYPLDDYEVVM